MTNQRENVVFMKDENVLTNCTVHDMRNVLIFKSHRVEVGLDKKDCDLPFVTYNGLNQHTAPHRTGRAP